MLALVGSGEYLSEMAAVDRRLLDALDEAPRVVCLATAAGGETDERIEYWSELGVRHFQRLGAAVEALPIVDRASANDPHWAARISNANFVYLSGGRPDYLYAALKQSLAWRAVGGVLAQGGMLAGCSAGAMVQGERFLSYGGWRTGFNLLPGVSVIPHFDELPAIFTRTARALIPDRYTIIGIEAKTALWQRTDGVWEVLGRGGVTISQRNSSTRYRAGPIPQIT
jgi:cyanophycinase